MDGWKFGMEGKKTSIPLIVVGYFLLAISLFVASISVNYLLVSIPFVAVAIGLLWKGAPRYSRSKIR